jgi:Ankyrin repeats (many copies)/Ankyrin repeat
MKLSGIYYKRIRFWRNSRQLTRNFFQLPINHWFYVGDTGLHLAAAGHRTLITELLLKHGADPNARSNRRRSSPLHYAADGFVNNPGWDPNHQIKTMTYLVESGADIHAADKNGATPLHRAVRTRSAAAVKYLLDAGSDPGVRNKSGSTPFHLAVQNTGKSGSGDAPAIAGQRQIIEEFLTRKVSAVLRDGKGKTVLESANAVWIKEILLKSIKSN